MINRVGVSSIKNSSNKNRGKNKSTPNSFNIGRVTDIILNENHPEYGKFGGVNSIGLVFFEGVDNVNTGTTKSAKPLHSNNIKYPIIGEFIVYITAPTPNYNNSKNYKNEFYYLTTLNLWNSPHHNSLPNPNSNSKNILETLNYQQIEAGLYKSNLTPPKEINFNSSTNKSQNTFIERSNIHPLMPFMGDVIYEGRFGNSIRLGGTAKTDSTYSNNWSEDGEDGNPIFIIRNGQPKDVSGEGFVPITEDINNDLSSFYQTSTQKIPIELANEDYFSYTTAPLSPNQYNLPQNILNSDRIVINAKKDHVLVSGEKSINLSSNDSVNIDSKHFITDSSDIKFGSKNATEPLLLGNKLVDLLDELMDGLTNVLTVLETDTTYPNPTLSLVATNVKVVINKIKSQLPDTKSKISKTV